MRTVTIEIPEDCEVQIVKKVQEEKTQPEYKCGDVLISKENSIFLFSGEFDSKGYIALCGIGTTKKFDCSLDTREMYWTDKVIRKANNNEIRDLKAALKKDYKNPLACRYLKEFFNIDLFKDGDILMNKTPDYNYMFILKRDGNETYLTNFYVALSNNKDIGYNVTDNLAASANNIENYRLATQEERLIFLKHLYKDNNPLAKEYFKYFTVQEILSCFGFKNNDVLSAKTVDGYSCLLIYKKNDDLNLYTNAIYYYLNDYIYLNSQFPISNFVSINYATDNEKDYLIYHLKRCNYVDILKEVFNITPIKTYQDLIDSKMKITGYFIDSSSATIETINNSYFACNTNKDVAYSEKIAKSMLAMAMISQLMPYYGGAIIDEEWENTNSKYVISKIRNTIHIDDFVAKYHFLAFRTKNLRDEFLKYNEQLVKDYLMID